MSQEVQRDKLRCFICGGLYKSIPSHVYHSHGMTKKQYCIKYGLDINEPLLYQGGRIAISSYQKDYHSNLNQAQKEDRKNRFSNIRAGIEKLRNPKIKAEVTCSDCSISFLAEGVTAKMNRFSILCKSCKKERKKTNDKISRKGQNREGITVKCDFCRKSFKARQYHHRKRIRDGLKVFCSQSCSGKKNRKQPIY
jgi:hypothetical protein